MKFKDLEVGECFEYKESYFVKIPKTPLLMNPAQYSFHIINVNSFHLQGKAKGKYADFKEYTEVTKIVFTGVHALEEK